MASKTGVTTFSGVYLLMATAAYIGCMIVVLTAGCVAQGLVEPAGSWARYAYLCLAILAGPLAAAIVYLQNPRRSVGLPLTSLACWIAGGVLGSLYFMLSVAGAGG